MPTIMPVTALRNYPKVLSEVAPGSPVFLTKNGHGQYALEALADHERREARWALLTSLAEGELSARAQGFVPLDESGLSEPGGHLIHLSRAALADLRAIQHAATREQILHSLRAAAHLPDVGLPLLAALGIPTDVLYLDVSGYFPLYRLESEELRVLRVLSGKQPVLA